MGYYTSFSISHIEGDFEEYKKMLAELADSTGFPKITEETLYAKWYDCEKDCLAISKKYPDILFQVDGDGEESLDYWSARFKNGVVDFVERYIARPDFSILATKEERNNSWKLVVIDLCMSILYSIPLEIDEHTLSQENQAAFIKHISNTYGINLDKFSWGIVNQFSTLKKKST